MRTSATHPLEIASVPAPGSGVVGVTFCPGKCQPYALTGAWARDLDIDLTAIQTWGAELIVTLVTSEELQELGVSDLGDRARARRLAWVHCPIVDVAIPTAEWEVAWVSDRGAVHEVLDRGGRVLIHCKGGLGRAGLVAARILIERGAPPAHAIQAVRAVRPGAIETAAQEAYVASLGHRVRRPEAAQ